MTELEQYIKAAFAITQEDLQHLSSKFKLRTLSKGDYFLKNGRLSDQLGFIKTGIMRIYAAAGDKEVTQWISTQGSFITDLSSFVFQTPARRNIQALTDCELYSIDRDTYHRLGEVIPQWSEIDKLFIAKCFLVMEDRIFHHLHMSAEERYNLLFEQQPALFNQVPLQYLASMLGMSPETLSRIRKKHLS